MKIKEYITPQEMKVELDKWNESKQGSATWKPAKLREYMLVESEDIEDSRYRYHVYESDGTGYKLVNAKPYNVFLKDATGKKYKGDKLRIQKLI